LPKMDIERRIDLSYGAAKALGMLHDGRQRVRVSVPMPIPRPDIERREAQSGSKYSGPIGQAGLMLDTRDRDPLRPQHSSSGASPARSVSLRGAFCWTHASIVSSGYR
jgi:rare lipoprotein A (peptidoglycan hydrolase)